MYSKNKQLGIPDNMTASDFKLLNKKKKKRNKYTRMTKEERVLNCKCSLGHIHDSRDEARYCDTLSFLKKQKQIKNFKGQVLVPIYINNIKITTCRVDFEVVLNDGSVVWHEFKGFETREWLLKKKLMWAIYGKNKYIIKKKKDINLF